AAIASRRWDHVLEGKFWTQWTSEALGLSPEYALGDDFPDFLTYPLLAGRRTYLVALGHLLAVALGAAILLRAAAAWWRDRARWQALWIGRDSSTAFTQNAAFLGFGVLLTLTGSVIPPHYLSV